MPGRLLCKTYLVRWASLELSLTWDHWWMLLHAGTVLRDGKEILFQVNFRDSGLCCLLIIQQLSRQACAILILSLLWLLLSCSTNYRKPKLSLISLLFWHFWLYLFKYLLFINCKDVWVLWWSCKTYLIIILIFLVYKAAMNFT